MASRADWSPAQRQELEELLTDIAREGGYIGGACAAALNPKVLAALRAVPRHAFVPAEMADQAYGNYPLSIGHSQTISQPFIVALMSGLLNLPADATVLEIGTGSGYQGAVLAQLARQVYSIEIVPQLAHLAEQRFAALDIANVAVRCGDGYQGWAEHAPYDGIIVTAAAPHLPQPLLDQLKPGARLVIPVGLQYHPQELLVIKKHADGSVSGEDVLPVAFVPLTGSLGVPHEVR